MRVSLSPSFDFTVMLTIRTEYVISMPNMYARGILWGKMFLELGDSCTAKNEQTGHFADIQFKTKVRTLVPSGDRATKLKCALARV